MDFPLVDTPLGNQRFVVQFGPEWKECPSVGLVLNQTDSTDYQFLLADDAYDPRYPRRKSITLGEANELGRLQMVIKRGLDILRIQPIVLMGDPKLSAVREHGTDLSFTVNDGRKSQTITFVDPFPIPQGKSSKVGLLCPLALSVLSFSLEKQTEPVRANSELTWLQRGDQAFANGESEVARNAYLQAGDDIEALYKLTLLPEVDNSARAEILQQILKEFPPGQLQNERQRQWYLAAAVSMLEIAHEGTISRGEILDILRANYRLRDVMTMVPAAQWVGLKDDLFISGQKFRLAFRSYGEEEQDIRKLAMTLELFCDSPEDQRQAYWRLADAYQIDPALKGTEGFAEAEQILRDLLGINNVSSRNPAEFAERLKLVIPEPQSHLERVALMRELVWLLIYTGRPADAMEVVQPWLDKPMEQLPSSLWPLYVERARIRIALGQLNEAETDLRKFIDRVDPANPPHDVRYEHFGEASGILGILRRDAGASEEAKAIWTKARRREWKDGFPDPNKQPRMRGTEMSITGIDPDPFLAPRTDGHRPAEVRSVIQRSTSGLGLDNRVVREILFSSQDIPAPWLDIMAQRVWDGPRWSRVADDCLLRRLSPHDWGRLTAEALMYQAVLHIAYGGDEALKEFPDLDQVLAEQVNKVYGHFEAGRIEQENFEFYLRSFLGQWNDRQFLQVERKLNDVTVTSGLALVAAHRLYQDGRKAEGAELLQKYVLSRAEQLPPVYSAMANRLLK